MNKLTTAKMKRMTKAELMEHIAITEGGIEIMEVARVEKNKEFAGKLKRLEEQRDDFSTALQEQMEQTRKNAEDFKAASQEVARLRLALCELLKEHYLGGVDQ